MVTPVQQAVWVRALVRTYTELMKKHYAARLLASGFLVWTSLGFSDPAATGREATTSATDPGLDMVTRLQAMGPHPSLGEQAQVFGRFVLW